MTVQSLYFVACVSALGIAQAACVADEGDAEPGVEAPAESEATSSLTTPQLRGQWEYYYAGGPFGLSIDVAQGSACSPHRERSHFTVERSNGSGRCESRGWYSNDPKDCRAWIHVGANWNEAGRCTTRVYEHPANVVLFVDHWFQGASKRFDPGAYDVGALGIPNDSLSSIKVPPGWTATLFQHANFNINDPGWSLVLTSDSTDLGIQFGSQYADNASSMIVTKLPGAPN